MTFSSLGVTRDNDGFHAELKGKVHGETLTGVQDKLNGFLASVRKGGILSDVEYVPLDIRPRKEADRQLGYEQEFRVSFRLSEGEERR